MIFGHPSHQTALNATAAACHLMLPRESPEVGEGGREGRLCHRFSSYAVFQFIALNAGELFRTCFRAFRSRAPSMDKLHAADCSLGL